MVNKIEPDNIVTIEEVLIANAIEQEALVNLLVRKGLIDKKEVNDEIIKIKKNLKVTL